MNSKTDLKELAARESEQVEWKKNVANIEDVIRTITAFSSDFQNMGGGYVVCGAEESKDEHGFQKVSYPGLTSDRFKEIEGKVMSDAREKIDPAVAPIVDELPGEIDGQRVLVFIVPATGYAHSYRPSGKDSAAYYVRLSRETIEAKNGVLRELLVRKQALPPWDRRLSESAGIPDVDLLAFRDVLTQVGVWNPSVAIEDYFADSMRVSDFVPPLGGKRPLDSAIHPRNFALLLFGKEPTRFFPGAWTKVSFYPGKDRSEQTAERHELTGTVVGQAKKALELLKTHASTVYDKESPEPNASKYPERALQEAVINAIVHRDYEQEEPTSITVFADRVEIRSPGALPRAVNKEKFLAGQASPSWRNQSLAYFFNKLQLAQAEGQGIPTIIRTMKQLGSPAPRFDLEEAAVTCVLPAHPRHEMMRHVAEIERLIIQQDYDEAQAKLKPLLDEQSTNPKLLELLVQLASMRHRPETVGVYTTENQLQPQDLPTSTVYQFAEVLGQSPKSEHQQIGKLWLEHVSRRSLEGDEVKRVSSALRKLGKDEQAVQLISKYISAATSPLAVPAMLYDVRARAKIDLAKKCMDTGKDRRVLKERQAKAWELCRTYLDEAEADIVKALEIEARPREKEFYEKDLEFVRMMKQQVRKPAQREGSSRPYRSNYRRPNR
jgi:predicted HTH transcriptional regulator